MTIPSIHKSIDRAFREAGKGSLYTADANEPDPRYLSYGVRAAGKKEVISAHAKQIRALSTEQKLELATRLMKSGYGEQQSVALYILDSIADYFTADRLDLIDEFVRLLRGWSKVDSFTGSLLRFVLEAHPQKMTRLVRAWNRDEDLWPRRTSVVLFTRKVAASGRFDDLALECCDRLKHDPEDLVLKGVGWCLKDLMRHDKKRILRYVKELRNDGVSSVVTLYAMRDLPAAERKKVIAETSAS